MSTIVRDVRYALVTMRRNPWFTSAALATLALGIGATTLVFTVVHGLLIRPLPFPESERLVRLWEEHPGGTTAAGNRWLSNRTLEGWAVKQTIEGIGAYATREYTVRLGDEAERLAGAQMTPSVFSLLRAVPAMGRFFTDEDAKTPNVLVISDRLWRERFNASADVLGARVTVGEDVYTIVGVAQSNWQFPDRWTQFWVPYAVQTSAEVPQRVAVFTALGRLAPGATPAQAGAEGTAAARSVARPMANFFFGEGGPVVVHARPLADDVAAPARSSALVLAAAVACLLLMASANVANLLLSRGIARERELAVRFAIGGSTARIVRQMLTESLVLSLLGGAIGVLSAWWLLRSLPIVAPARLPRVEHMQLDWRVLLFAFAATLLVALAAGLAPALRGSQVDLAQAFRGGDGSSHAGFRGRRGRRTRDLLLVAESAVAVMLLVAASLLARSFVQLTLVDAGYTPERVIVASVVLPRSAPPERMTGLIDSVVSELRSRPGIMAAGAANMTPMFPATAITTLTLEGMPGTPDARTARARTYVVTPGLAQALGLRLRTGRFFTDGDERAGVRPMIVNEAFVQQHLSDGRPAIGRVFGDVYPTDKGTRTRIVGIVGNVLKDGNDAAPEPEVYVPHDWRGGPTRQRIGQFVNIAVRATIDPAAMAPAMRDSIHRLDSTALVTRVEPLEATVSASMAQPRFAARTIGAFALVALLLAAVGLFGVLSYTVAERRRELGIRAALGAPRGRLLGLVIRQGLLVTGMGIALGLLGAAGLTRFMQAALFGITPLDPLSFAAAPLLLIPIAALACLGPALRAASADPTTVLRST